MHSVEILPFPNVAAFHDWLDANGSQSQELWVRFYKKGVAHPTITYDESVDAALCHGWIDGKTKSFDAESYLIRFTPRKAGGPWSKINVAKAERLLAEGKMRPAGIAQMEAAKSDGRWDRAYSGSKDFVFPPDFLAAVNANPDAAAHLVKLSRLNQYAMYYRLQTTKSAATREKKLHEYVAMLARGESIY